MQIPDGALLALLLLSVTGTLRPQAPVAESTCNTEFAKSVVEQQVAESKSVQDTDKRVQILIRSADFIWKLDQPAARSYFAEALKVAADRFAEKGFERSESNGMIFQKPDYRFEVIRAIAKWDSEWAKRLIDQLLKEYEKVAEERNQWDKDREIDSIMRIAQASVKTNPELSWYLFRRVMRSPAGFHWFWALYFVAGEDPRFADRLYVELLRNYSSASPRRFLFFSAYPFASPRVLGVDKFSYGASIPDDMRPNQALQTQFIEAFIRRVSTYATDPANAAGLSEAGYPAEPVYMVSALRELEPLVIEKFPNLLQRFSEARAHATALLTEEMRKTMDDRERFAEATGRGFDRRLEIVEEADGKGKLTDSMIVNLLISHTSQRTEEEFKKIEPWLDKIKDESMRNETINYFWFLRSKLAVKENRLEDASRFAGKVPELEHRSILMFEIAQAQIKDLNEAAAVYRTLADVRKVAEQSENSISKARVLLGLASVYEKVNHNFAISELSDAVKIINRLESGNMLSQSVLRQIRGKDFSFHASYVIPGFDLESTFQLLSKNDFDLTLSNARALDDRFYRTLAVIAIARNCIDRPKPKPAVKPVSKQN